MVLDLKKKSSAFSRRLLFIGLLIVCLVVAGFYSREDDNGPLHTVQATVVGLFSPLGYVGSSIDSATDAVEEVATDVMADEDSLVALREYNETLVQQYTQMEEYRLENERLRALLGLQDAYDIEGVSARVIGRSSHAWDQTITINKGSNDGISTGLTVMGSSGVVGQVIQVTAFTAEIRLLTDPDSGAAAMIQSSRAEGIVYGSLEGLLYLESLEDGATVQLGDVVVTSGLGGSYEKGLIIGTVVQVSSNQGDSTQRIVVSPNDTVQSLEEVLVVFGLVLEDSETE